MTGEDVEVRLGRGDEYQVDISTYASDGEGGTKLLSPGGLIRCTGPIQDFAGRFKFASSSGKTFWIHIRELFKLTRIVRR